LAVFKGISVDVALIEADFWTDLVTGVADAFRLLTDPTKESSAEKLRFLL
jgi:hypothetical protein